jgi:hypothetical protein
MTTSIQRTIVELEAQANRHDSAAARVRQIITQLRALPGSPTAAAPPANKAPAPTRRRKAKATPATRKTPRAAASTKRAKPTLATALQYVLSEHHKGNGGGATSAQLYAEIGKAGYRFTSKNTANNRHYLYNTLRTNQLFKRQNDGRYVLA